MLLLLLLLLLLSLVTLPRKEGEVTCLEKEVAKVDGETAPRRHGLGDTERGLPDAAVVGRLRFGLSDVAC